MKTPARSHAVASYYDRNTRRFIQLGGSGELAAIHRQIWPPGIQSSMQAFLYLNQLVANTLQTTPRPIQQVLDLGCGVGGTATWLAEQNGYCVTGITNSPVQRQWAEDRARRLGMQGRCRFILGDYLELPAIGPFEAAYAIESFVHTSQPARFFQQAAQQLIPGSRLILCDDFLAEGSAVHQRRAQGYLRQFQTGWQIGTLLTAPAVQQLALEAGLQPVDCLDLTAYLRLQHALVLYPLAWITRLPLRQAYWHNLSGGLALQVCIHSGWVRYQALVFEKKGAS